MFGHKLHLQKGRSRWHLGDLSLEWWSMGSIIGAQLGEQYAVLAAALGAAPHQGLDVPPPDTLEGTLAALPESHYLFKSGSLATALSSMAPDLVLRTDTAPNNGYFPLDSHRLNEADGVVFLRDV